jgi:hypothetical protein
MYCRAVFPTKLATIAERIPVISSVKVTRDPLRFGLIEWPAVTVTPGLLDTHTNFSLSENSLMRQMTERKFGWMIRTRLSRPIGPSSKGSIREIDLVQSGQCLTSMRTAQIRSTGAAITNAVSKCLMSVSLSGFRGNSALAGFLFRLGSKAEVKTPSLRYPLYSRKRTCAVHSPMSALGHKRTSSASR